MISSHPLPRLLLSAAFVGLTAAALAGCQTVSTEDITGSTGRGGLLNNASAARAPEGEAAHAVPPAPHPARDEEPKL